ncbi:MAG: hypothetical protein SFH39_04890 [Candidatus Magnetobacterium sp. LHC-1]|nr:hypothetical protein [Nitrospirota bacterium]
MKRNSGLVVALLVAFAVAVFGGCVTSQEKKEGASVNEGSILYVCDCGPDCRCKDAVSVHPGKCPCGRESASTHVLKIEGDEAVLCTCGASCSCTIDPKDPTKCSCGKPVKKVSLKGLYVCSCGAGCTCNTVSDKPGKCKCGADLRKVE